MGAWLAPVLGGLGAGVLVAVLAAAFRRAAPKWAGGGRLAVLIVAAVVLGAAVPLLLATATARPAGQKDDPFTRIAAQLRSGELGERLAALDELDRMAQDKPGKVAEIAGLLSGFVRGRAPAADDPRCAGSGPAEDVTAALGVLRARPVAYDTEPAVDLHGTCLANADLRNIFAPGGTFAGANLAGATLKSADLAGADLHGANLAGTSLAGTNLVGTNFIGARFADTDLGGTNFSDDTLWPPQHEDAVMAASSFATTTFVIRELVLSDPR